MMKRRTFIRNSAGLFVLVTPFADLHASELTEAEMAARLEQQNVDNDCQSRDSDNYIDIAGAYTGGKNGLLASSIGCRSPHKHLLFLPVSYLENPDLIERELEPGTDYKIFETSPAFDMSLLVRKTVPRHTHEVRITKADLYSIINNPEGIKKVAFQPVPIIGNFLNLTEPGHLFKLKLS
jgi:hypothetical protein